MTAQPCSIIGNIEPVTQLMTKSEGESINSILRLLLQKGGSMGQEDNINHHWDLTPERDPTACNLCSGKRRLSRAVRSKTRVQRKSKVCKRIGVRQRPVLIVETRGQSQEASPPIDLLSRIVHLPLFYMLLKYYLDITLHCL